MLSTDGGRISLWDIQGENIEFDENYTRLVGMEQRTFVRTDFLKYAYPDDVPLLEFIVRNAASIYGYAGSACTFLFQ